jgi:hypothetical protein
MTKPRPRNIANDILDCVETATAKWTKQKKSEERHPGNIRYRVSCMTKEPRMSQKEAAWEVLEDAYMAASGGGALPAMARQIYYQARPKIARLRRVLMHRQENDLDVRVGSSSAESTPRTR